MWQWIFFALIDIFFFSTLVGMYSCVEGSKFVYISEWIRQCKQSDVSHQFLPVVVLISFILMVQCQMDWMFRTACTAHTRSQDNLDTENLIDINSEKIDAHITRHLTLVMTSKLACVVGAIFVFAYDYQYTSVQTALVYTHYYGVFLLSLGLLGLIHAILWQLIQAHNNKYLRWTNPTIINPSPFYTVDFVLVFAIIVFFGTTLASQNTSESATRWWSVLTEYITFILIAIEFVLLCYRCTHLSSNKPMQLVYSWSRFALIFLVLMVPVLVFQFIEIPRTCPSQYIIYDNYKTCTRCPSFFSWINLTHCCETSLQNRPQYTGPNWQWPNRKVCYTCDTQYQWCEFDV